MFTVPVHISPKFLFGATEFLTALPVTRLGAGREANTVYYEVDKKTPITHLVPQSNVSTGEEINFSAYKKTRPVRDDIQLCSNVLFYRRFLSKQQPCGICERPLSVFEFNAIQPCAHIVHVCCYEENILNHRSCLKCNEDKLKRRKALDEFIKFICCLYTYE